MGQHTYKILELTGTSNSSIEEAVQGAIAKASKSVRKMRWFEVVETRGMLEDDKVSEWQVTLKVGFRLEE